MNAIAKCKKCGRDFNVQGNAFTDEDNLKTSHSTGSSTEEKCSHCGYFATYEIKELIWENK